MAFYAGKLVQQPEMANPTLVVLTDRNDLDDQLFGTFAAATSCCGRRRCRPTAATTCATSSRSPPAASSSRPSRSSCRDEHGEPHPLLSDRDNIVVIADEAHRSQYDFIDGFARHLRDALPNASFIGFTGTPIELTDKNTRAVFGDYIDTYDIQRAVEDGATVPIYYEGRLAKIDLPEEQQAAHRRRVRGGHRGRGGRAPREAQEQVGALEAMVGTDKRLELVATDLVEHFEARQAGNRTPQRPWSSA